MEEIKAICGRLEEGGISATMTLTQWTRAESYRAVALASRGDYPTALKIARAVAVVPVPPERAATNGGRMLMWEGRTLPARILLRRGGAGDLAEARKLMPDKDEVRKFGDKSLVGWCYQAYATVIGARVAIEQGKVEDANLLAEELTRLGESFVKTRQAAVGIGERSEWLRFFKALEVMASEMRGMVAMEGPPEDIGSAFNWFRSAADRQARPTLMMPPAVLLPMQVRLGQYYGAKKEWNKAVEILIEGFEGWPNDWELLNHLQIALSNAGLKEQADDAARKLEEMRKD